MGDSERVRPVVRVSEFAELLGVSVKRAYGMIAEDKVPGVIRLGRRVLLSRAALERWLDGEHRDNADGMHSNSTSEK